MTEKEIIEYLVNNRRLGVAFDFMPENVKKYCYSIDKKLLRAYFNEHWAEIDDNYDFRPCDVISMGKDYFFTKGEWIECEIDNNGNFLIPDKGNSQKFFHWSDWGKCLDLMKETISGFGGWQYQKEGAWFVVPMMERMVVDDFVKTHSASNAELALPLVPKKIRFWRKY